MGEPVGGILGGLGSLFVIYLMFRLYYSDYKHGIQTDEYGYPHDRDWERNPPFWKWKAWKLFFLGFKKSKYADESEPDKSINILMRPDKSKPKQPPEPPNPNAIPKDHPLRIQYNKDSGLEEDLLEDDLYVRNILDDLLKEKPTPKQTLLSRFRPKE